MAVDPLVVVVVVVVVVVAVKTGGVKWSNFHPYFLSNFFGWAFCFGAGKGVVLAVSSV